MTNESNQLNQALFSEIERAFGRVPNIFKAYAKYPPLLEANWNKVKAIMPSGALRREVKEVIALLVSRDNECKYCIAAHSAALRSLKTDQIRINAFLQDNLSDSFTSKEIALIEFVRKANLEWHAISDLERKNLSELGIEEAELLEAIGVMEIFIAFNRFADIFDLEIDFP